MSDLKSVWTKNYLQSGAIFMFFSPIWVPIADGKGLQWPTAEYAGVYIIFAIGGIAGLWWARRIKIPDEDE